MSHYLVRRIAAVGTLIACSASGKASLLRAFSTQHNATKSQVGKEVTLPFDIPAGTVATALLAFETEAHWKVVATSAMGSLASPGVSGNFTPQKALDKLLTGTGLDYRFTGQDTVTLELTKMTIAVEVTAAAPAIPVSPKFNAPLLDTPQSISVVTHDVMEQQGATTLRDALRNVAGISLAAGEGGSQGDNLTVRGFTARNDLYIDGMRDFGSYYRDPFNTEEVAVLQGPSSVTFGRGSTGGVVNQSTKNARIDPLFKAEIDGGTDLTRRILIDVDQPLPMLGHGAAIRVNLMGTEGNIAERDVAENRRFGAATSLIFGAGTATRWSLNQFHQTGLDIPDYGIPYLFNGPAPVARTNYYGFANANYLRTYDDIGTARVEHDVNKHITVRSQTRYANYVRDVLITEAQVPAGVTLATPLASIKLTRNQLASNSQETDLDQQLDMNATFNTGKLRHSFVAGVEATRETSDPTRPKYSGVPTADLLNPNPNDALTGTVAPNTAVKATALGQSAYVLETMHIGRKFDITGGLRFDRLDADYSQSVAPAAAFTRVDNMTSWRTSAVYKPVSGGTVYASAGTSFNPSAESLSLSAANASLPPEHNTSYEVGTKWDLRANGRLTVQAALFRTEKTNAREPDPTNSLLNVLAGNQRVDGLQLEARGRLTSRWEILSSYARLNSEVLSSNFYPASVGAQLANVPQNTFNFWNTFRLPSRVTTGFGGNYVSSRTASSTAPNDPVTGLVKGVPGYWVFNAMAERRLNDHMVVQVNVNNLTNRYYYDQLHPAHIVLGPGRSALAALKWNF